VNGAPVPLVRHEHYGRGSPFTKATGGTVVRAFTRSGDTLVESAEGLNWIWAEEPIGHDIVQYEILVNSGNGVVLTPYLLGDVRPRVGRLRVVYRTGVVADEHPSTVQWTSVVAYTVLSTEDDDVVNAEVPKGDQRGTVDTREYSGAKTSYYELEIRHPTRDGRKPYTAECNDIIEAAGMTFAEGEAFKALWRGAVARLGLSKRGYTDGLYDAQKVAFYGGRMVVQQQAARESDNPF